MLGFGIPKGGRLSGRQHVLVLVDQGPGPSVWKSCAGGPASEGWSWDGAVLASWLFTGPTGGLHVCLPQVAHGPRGLKGEKGEPAVLEPVSHMVAELREVDRRRK